MRFKEVSSRDLYQEIRLPRVANAMTRDEGLLEELVLNVSEGCNLCCSYCFAEAGRYGSSVNRWMSQKTAYESVISTFNKYRQITSIKLFGGEPFMNIEALQGCCDALEYLQTIGRIDRNEVRVGCVTNGTDI